MSQQDCLGHSPDHGLNETDSSTLVNGRYKGKLASSKVVNLSSRNLTSNEISLISKGLNFVPTPRGVNKALIKEELEVYGRKCRLMWHFLNDEREFSYGHFKKRSKFYPKRKNAAIELYLSHLEEEISSLDYKVGYSNLTKGERDVVYSLKNDITIIIEEVDKESTIAWDREDYLIEEKKQFDDKNVYKELTGDVEGPLEKTIKTVLKKGRQERL